MLWGEPPPFFPRCENPPELLYNRFTSKDHTSILVRVLKGKVDLRRRFWKSVRAFFLFALFTIFPALFGKSALPAGSTLVRFAGGFPRKIVTRTSYRHLYRGSS